MTASLLRARRPRRALPYLVVERTQHWRIIDGRFYRDCVVQLADGRQQLRSVRDDLVAA